MLHSVAARHVRSKAGAACPIRPSSGSTVLTLTAFTAVPSPPLLPASIETPLSAAVPSASTTGRSAASVSPRAASPIVAANWRTARQPTLPPFTATASPTSRAIATTAAATMAVFKLVATSRRPGLRPSPTGRGPPATPAPPSGTKCTTQSWPMRRRFQPALAQDCTSPIGATYPQPGTCTGIQALPKSGHNGAYPLFSATKVLLLTDVVQVQILYTSPTSVATPEIPCLRRRGAQGKV